jgi:hypothetical protein
MAASLQLIAQVLVIVNLGIGRDLDTPVAEGLLRARRVEHGQTTMPQADSLVGPESLAIRTPMDQKVGHPLKPIEFDRTIS